MRAPVQKKRPRRKGAQPTSQEVTPPSGTAADGRRRARVRNRLVIAVAVVAAAVAGAGAPGILDDSGRLSDSQDLVTLSEQTQAALALAHALADERDETAAHIAAGRPSDKAPGAKHRAQVDRRVRELRTDAPAALRRALDTVAAARRSAQSDDTSALDVHRAYGRTITGLHALAERLAERMPARAPGGSHALADLDTAVQQTSAARGLLLAALSVPRGTEVTTLDPVTGLPVTSRRESRTDRAQRRALSEAAQRAHHRSEAALAAFRDTAPAKAVGSYDSTVTGSGVREAESQLARLTDTPELSRDEQALNRGELDADLLARIELMRGAESSLHVQRSKELAALRDDDVTALEIRAVLVGLCLLLAAGFSMATFRSLTRPLAVLRIGSARLAGEPATEEPIRFTGRNDEFAQVVSSVNALHTHALSLHERLTSVEAERRHLIGQRQMLAEEREQLRAELASATAELERVEHSIHATFVSLALRTLGLVERQLAVIEGLEEREQDPDRLSTLYRLDHFATLMRRHSENLLVLAGTEHRQPDPGPVPLVDVVRAAVSEIERYERVRITALPPHTHIAGFAADDLSHLLAELLDNAAAFSPPDTPVEISGWLLENGNVMLSAADEGIGLDPDRLRLLNARLGEFDPEAPHGSSAQGEDDATAADADTSGKAGRTRKGGKAGKAETSAKSGPAAEGAAGEGPQDGLGLGLYVAGRLAHRLGVRVELREQKSGGVTAVVVVPKSVLTTAPAAGIPPQTTAPVPGAAPAVRLPGTEAEANSNALLGRSERVGAGAVTGTAEGTVDGDADTDLDAGSGEGTAVVRSGDSALAEGVAEAGVTDARATDAAVTEAGVTEVQVTDPPATEARVAEAAGTRTDHVDAATDPEATDTGAVEAATDHVRPGTVDAEAGPADIEPTEPEPDDSVPAHREPAPQDAAPSGSSLTSDPFIEAAERALREREIALGLRPPDPEDTATEAAGTGVDGAGVAGADDTSAKAAGAEAGRTEDFGSLESGAEARTSGDLDAEVHLSHGAVSEDQASEDQVSQEWATEESRSQDSESQDSATQDSVTQDREAPQADDKRDSAADLAYGTEPEHRATDRAHPAPSDRADDSATVPRQRTVVDPYAIGPDRHERTVDAAAVRPGAVADDTAHHPEPAPHPQDTGDTARPTTAAGPGVDQRTTGAPGIAVHRLGSTGDAPREPTDRRTEPTDGSVEPAADRTGDPAHPTEAPATAGHPGTDQPAPSGPPLQGTGPEPAKWNRLTGKGLPKRTPRVAAPPPSAAPRAGGVDPQELRRKLGGFRRGSLAGRRDADAELAGASGEDRARLAEASGEDSAQFAGVPGEERAEFAGASGEERARIAGGTGEDHASGDPVEEASS